MKDFINELTSLCERYRVTLSGQLLVLKDQYPQNINYAEQAHFGSIPVRDSGGLIFSPVKPEPKPVSMSTLKKIQVQSDINGYTCPVTGKWVDGRRDHRENLKRTGCRILETGEKERFVRDRPKEIDRSSEKAADFLSDRIVERLTDIPA